VSTARLRPFLTTGALFLAGAAVGVIAARSGVDFLDLLPGDLSGREGAVVVALLPLLYFVAVAAHEAGHVLGGRIVAFRLLLFIVGPFRLERGADGFTAGLNRSVLLGGGLAAMTPLGLHDLRRRTIVVVAMGPTVSLIVGAQLLALHQATLPLLGPPGAAAFRALASLVLLLLGAVSLLLGVVTLVPTRAGGFYSDGARMLRLMKASDQAEREVALIALTGMSMAGTRPRDWDPALVERCAGIADGGPFEAGGRQLAYAHALDRGDIAAARSHLEAALGTIAQFPAPARASLLLAAATFHALYDGDAERARSFLQQARGRQMLATPHQRRLAEAAIRLAEGDVAGARELARDARRLTAGALDRGGAALDEALAGRILVSEESE
jgi:hypothetical protein